MPLHLIVALPDGRTACADYRDPVAPAMNRVHAAIAQSRPQPEADLAAVAAWLDGHEEQSARCREGLWPGKACEHD